MLPRRITRFVVFSSVLGQLPAFQLALLGGHEGVADDRGNEAHHCEDANHPSGKEVA